MNEDSYLDIILESTLTIMEEIQQNQQPIAMTRNMDNEAATFTFHKVLPDGTSIFAENKVRREPYLAVDLQNLFTTFYQVLSCVGVST